MTTITPVYVFGSPTPVATVTSAESVYAVHALRSSNNIYWSSTNGVVKTYGITYSTAWLDMYENPLTDLNPVPTPACTITDVFSAACGSGSDANYYCNIYGGTVEVYDWPNVTPGPDGTFANTTKPVNPSTTEISGITMTLPSMYMGFEFVYAADSCLTLGSVHKGSILAFDPTSISTIYDGPGFMSDAVSDGASVYNFGDLGPTINAPTYERQVDCVVNDGCKTIYPTYAPTISVPSGVRALEPAWASCYPDCRGLYGESLKEHLQYLIKSAIDVTESFVRISTCSNAFYAGFGSVWVRVHFGTVASLSAETAPAASLSSRRVLLLEDNLLIVLYGTDPPIALQQ